MMEQRPYVAQNSYSHNYMNSNSEVISNQNNAYSHSLSVTSSPRCIPDPPFYKRSHSRSSSLSTEYFSDYDSAVPFCTPISEGDDVNAYPLPYTQYRLPPRQPVASASASSASAASSTSECGYFLPDSATTGFYYPDESTTSGFRSRAFSQTGRLGEVVPTSPTHSTLPRRRVQSAVDAMAAACPPSVYRRGSLYESGGAPLNAAVSGGAVSVPLNGVVSGGAMNGAPLNAAVSGGAMNGGAMNTVMNTPINTAMNGARYTTGQASRGDALYYAESLRPQPSHGRVYDSVRHAKHLSSTDLSTEKVNVLSPELLAVLESPFYSSLWYGQENEDMMHWRFVKADATAQLEEWIRQCIQLKKNCCVNQCRVHFLRLLMQFGSFVQVWVEFARMEMESGYYTLAEFILSTALLFHRHNLTLLSKFIKVEEKLQNREGLRRVFHILEDIPTQKALQLVVATAQSLAIIGGSSETMDGLLAAVLTGDEVQPG